MQPNFRISLPCLCAIIGAFVAQPAQADWSLFPESRHHLYETYGFFIDQQNSVLYREANRVWVQVSGNLPILGNDEIPSHPQFVFHLSGTDAMHVDSEGGVFTESLDTRVGLMFEFVVPDPKIAISMGYFHESGHTADGADDPSLAPLNLGYNFFRFRGVHDFGENLRLGLTFYPVSHAIPDDLPWAFLDEFAEYFPWGSREQQRTFSPFIATGLKNHFDFSGELTFHAQMGIAWGSHFEEHHSGDARLVIGYYTGPDPRAKYAQFDGASSSFGYFGLMFDL